MWGKVMLCDQSNDCTLYSKHHWLILRIILGVNDAYLRQQTKHPFLTKQTFCKKAYAL